MILIDRHHDEWDGHQYTCRECGSQDGSIASLTHAEDCPVKTPDSVDTPLNDDTLSLINRIQREVQFRLEENDHYIKDIADLDEIDGVKWYTQGSAARLVLGLGRTTSKGSLHVDDRRGIVLKYDPRIRFDMEYTPVSSNVDELYTWETAVETDTSHLFAEIIASARDGAWLAMEQCIPVYPSRRNVMKNRDALYDKQRLSAYIEKLNEAGWVDPDWKHGNIGVTDDGRTVLLDYGTGPRYDP